jgi:co-chaperonin GroES (HSP10)
MTAMKASLVEQAKQREHLAFDPSNLPIRVGLWNILVAPVRPKTHTQGGLELPEESKRAEDHLISIGKILDMGDFAYTAKTPSGIDLSTDTRKPKIGDYVLYDQYAGTRIVMRDNRTLIILTDTEIKGVMDPAQVSEVRFYL